MINLYISNRSLCGMRFRFSVIDADSLKIEMVSPGGSASGVQIEPEGEASLLIDSDSGTLEIVLVGTDDNVAGAE